MNDQDILRIRTRVLDDEDIRSLFDFLTELRGETWTPVSRQHSLQDVTGMRQCYVVLKPEHFDRAAYIKLKWG